VVDEITQVNVVIIGGGGGGQGEGHWNSDELKPFLKNQAIYLTRFTTIIGT